MNGPARSVQPAIFASLGTVLEVQAGATMTEVVEVAERWRAMQWVVARQHRAM